MPKGEVAAMPKSDVLKVEEAKEVIGFSEAEFEAFGTPETIHVEAADQLVFEDPGDLYIGVYAGHEIVYPDPEKDPTNFFIQLKWTDPNGAKFTNAGYELRNTYVEIVYDSDGKPTVTDKVPLGSMTRNELMKFVNVDQPTDMKSFRVDIARPRNADHSA